MPKKYPRADTDIASFAKDLAGRWQRGDGIEPWLRSLEAELSKKVRDERWSWESIARAMNTANILYQTGRSWTGTSLLQKITSIRYEARRHAKYRGDDTPRAIPGSVPAVPLVVDSRVVSQAGVAPVSASGAPALYPGAAVEAEEPEFRPATLKGWSGTKIVKAEAKPTQTKAPPEQGSQTDAAAVIARFLGKT